MNNNTILAIVFLTAGTMLTTTAVTTISAAYAVNKQKGSETCDGCFDVLSAEDKSTFEEFAIPRIFGSQITTIDQMCTFLEQSTQGKDPTPVINEISEALQSQRVDQNTISSITTCLFRALA